MGLFGQSPFDPAIEKATSETNTNENWSLILDVCDKTSTHPRYSKEILRAIMKRMAHADPHVVMQAITLLDACANNCGKPFQLEIASREFENEFRRLLSKAQPKVSLKMRQVLKNWAENDFKTDPELNLIPTLLLKLRLERVDFSNLNDDKPPKSAVAAKLSKDPNVVSSQQEEDDIAKAIELSLQETKNSPKHQSSGGSGAGVGSGSNSSGVTAGGSSAYPSLYPSFAGSGSLGSITSTGGASNNSANSQPEPRKVRALYDFEAAEENELTFFAGEIIHVLDDSDPNWWKGFNQRGDGLFPSNFVTADLSVEPERLDANQQSKTKKTVQFEDDARELQQKTEAAAAAAANQRIEVDESKIDRLLHLLHEANPEDPSQDSEEMLRLEQEVHQMGPLIDAELERVDRKHAQLTQLSSDLVDAVNLYHSLMRDDRAAMGAAAGVSMPGMMPPPPNMAGYAGVPNPQMLYGAAGYASGNFAPPQMYGMTGAGGLPYTNTGQLPVTSVNTVQQQHAAALTASMAGVQQQQLNAASGIPMQFQNGHVNAAQTNGVNALPPHMQSQPSQQLYGAPHQPGPGQQHPSQPGYQMLAQQPGQQQQQQQQQPPHSATAANNATTVAGPTQQQQQLPQFMSPQHPPQTQLGAVAPYMQHQQQQQHQHQQFAPMPNGAPQPSAFMTSPMMLQGASTAANSHGQPSLEHYSQLQQQMAAMSLAAGVGVGVGAGGGIGGLGMNQPVTQNFLVQNEPKNNIPIYQQQR